MGALTFRSEFRANLFEKSENSGGGIRWYTGDVWAELGNHIDETTLSYEGGILSVIGGGASLTAGSGLGIADGEISLGGDVDGDVLLAYSESGKEDLSTHAKFEFYSMSADDVNGYSVTSKLSNFGIEHDIAGPLALSSKIGFFDPYAGGLGEGYWQLPEIYFNDLDGGQCRISLEEKEILLQYLVDKDSPGLNFTKLRLYSSSFELSHHSLSTTRTSRVSSGNGTLSMRCSQGTPSASLSLDMSILSGITIFDSRSAPSGIKYNDDYSANFEDRSLVNKKWVEDYVTAAIAAI